VTTNRSAGGASGRRPPKTSADALHAATLRTAPLSAELWPDLLGLFGPRGACGGCWCQWWRQPRAEFETNKGEVNREALREQADSGEPVGLLGYLPDETIPVGWIACAPRPDYPVAARSPIAKRRSQDELAAADVWLITCLFVRKDQRRRGVAVALIDAAVEWAGGLGAKAVDAVPVEPRKAELPDVFAWTGLPAMFSAAGFAEVARPRPTRPVMRLVITL
jgi:GNAT superfamily N-acetyltransferase